MELTASSFVSLLVYILTFLLGLPGNLLVLFVYIRKARKHGATPNVVYALNLCVANLALVSWMPVKVAETLQGWALPAAVCPVYSFFLAILWLLVLVHLGECLACYENFTQEQLELLVPLRLEMALLLFMVPLVLSAFCTLRCLVLVRHSALPSVGKRRVLAIALSTLVVFVVCYLPYNVSHVVGFVLYTNVEWRSEAMLSCSCNVFLEPVVMLMLSASRNPQTTTTQAASIIS
uniref:Si:dkey-211g8.9 n=1 Tax=Sinocyclocheilus rhinocerous TaxID=307959 RepID=A0A673FWD5_9TELE